MSTTLTDSPISLNSYFFLFDSLTYNGSMSTDVEEILAEDFLPYSTDRLYCGPQYAASSGGGKEEYIYSLIYMNMLMAGEQGIILV